MSDATAPENRIRSFSRTVWLGGTIIVAIVGSLTFPRIAYDPNAGGIWVEGGPVGGERDYPWLQDEPRLLTPDEDGTVRGDSHGGYFELAPTSAALAIAPTQENDDSVGVSQGAAQDFDARSTDWPGNVGYLYEESDVAYLVPGTETTRVWFTSDLDEWAVNVEEVDALPVDGEISGTGNETVLYRGDALSATFTHTGTGFFRVTLAANGENRLAVNETDEVSTRASWANPGAALFVIESSTGSWSVRINE